MYTGYFVQLFLGVLLGFAAALLGKQYKAQQCLKFEEPTMRIFCKKMLSFQRLTPEEFEELKAAPTNPAYNLRDPILEDISKEKSFAGSDSEIAFASGKAHTHSLNQKLTHSLT